VKLIKSLLAIVMVTNVGRTTYRGGGYVYHRAIQTSLFFKEYQSK